MIFTDTGLPGWRPRQSATDLDLVYPGQVLWRAPTCRRARHHSAVGFSERLFRRVPAGSRIAPGSISGAILRPAVEPTSNKCEGDAGRRVFQIHLTDPQRYHVHDPAPAAAVIRHHPEKFSCARRPMNRSRLRFDLLHRRSIHRQRLENLDPVASMEACVAHVQEYEQ